MQQFTNSFIVLDFETTGFQPFKNEIIQIAAIKYEQFEEVDRFVTFIKPKKSIPPTITRVTKITNKDVQNAPTIDEIMPSFLAFLGDYTIVAHNASFDMNFLQAAKRQYGELSSQPASIDTVALAKRYLPNLVNYKLETIKHYLQLGQYASHEAEADCFVTYTLYKYCYDKAR